MYRSGGVCAAVLQKEPELCEHIAERRSFLQDGQEVLDPRTGSVTWIAFFSIFSRSGREEAPRVGRIIKGLIKEGVVNRRLNPLQAR